MLVPLDINLPPPAIVIIEQKRIEAVQAFEKAKQEEEARKAAEAARIAAEQAYAQLVNHVTNAYPRPNSFDYGWCTWFVAGLVNIPWSGNANRWDDGARAIGWLVDKNPTVGSVFQTDAGWAGHVGLVIAVEGDNILIREMNYVGWNRISTRWVNKAKFWYIHAPI